MANSSLPVINRDFPRVDPSKLEPWRTITAATAHEAMGRRGAMDSSIKPIGQGMRTHGLAFTCVCEPGDNLTLHAALKLARPGDVIVCSAGGFTEQGSFGDVMSSCAQAKGIAGLIIDSGVRDVAVIRQMGFPIFSKSVCMKGTVKESLGPINVPITIGGVLVNPGDLIVADDDGVVVVPAAEIDDIAVACKAREEKEARARARFTPEVTTWEVSGWGDRLKAKGVELDL